MATTTDAKKKPTQKKPTRKKPKRYPMVEFTFDDVYDDFVFRLPDLASMPLKVQIRGQENDVRPLLEVCRIAGADEDTIDAVIDLDGEEYGDFMQAWSKAGPMPAGKSGA